MDPADVINPTSTRDAALARVLAYRQRVRARPLLIRATLAVVGGGLFVVSLARGYQVSDRTIEAEARQALAAAPELQFKPGTRFDYSNSNYLLLGEIVHRASGQPLPEFLSAEIFQPLGLAMVVDPVGKVPNKAVSYEKGTGGNRSEYRVGNPAWEQIGDGGIQTTTLHAEG